MKEKLRQHINIPSIAFEDIVFTEEPATDLMMMIEVALENLRSRPDTYFAEKQRTLSLLNDQVVGAETCF